MKIEAHQMYDVASLIIRNTIEIVLPNATIFSASSNDRNDRDRDIGIIYEKRRQGKCTQIICPVS